jgi:plastocyanin
MARITAPMKIVTGCAVGLALIGAACATKSPSAAGPTTPVPTATGGGSGGGGYGGYGGGYGGGSSQGSGVTAAATMQQGPGGQFVFSPVKLTVTKGQTVDVKNVSSIPHTFTIQGKGIDAVNQAGQSQKVKIDLAPGTYTFVCRFHESSGMQGTLIVKG